MWCLSSCWSLRRSHLPACLCMDSQGCSTLAFPVCSNEHRNYHETFQLCGCSASLSLHGGGCGVEGQKWDQRIRLSMDEGMSKCNWMSWFLSWANLYSFKSPTLVQSVASHFCGSLIDCLFALSSLFSFFEKQMEQKERTLIHWFTLHCLLHKGLGWAKARNQELSPGLTHVWQRPAP